MGSWTRLCNEVESLIREQAQEAQDLHKASAPKLDSMLTRFKIMRREFKQ